MIKAVKLREMPIRFLLHAADLFLVGLLVLLMKKCARISHKEALLLGKQIGGWLYRLCRCEQILLGIEDPVSKLINKAFDFKISKNDRTDIARKSLENFGMLVTETLHSKIWPSSYLTEIIDIEGIENFHDAFSRGKGLLLLTAHYANWEILSGIPLHFGGFDITVITHNQPLPKFNRLLHNLRSAAIKRLCSSNELAASVALIRTLRKGEIIATLIDHCFKGGHFLHAPFFGKPAMTASGPAFLSHYTGAPCLPAFAIRKAEDPIKHLVKIYPPIFPSPGSDRTSDVFRILSEYRKSLEAHIRLDPGQFLWTFDPWH